MHVGERVSWRLTPLWLRRAFSELSSLPSFSPPSRPSSPHPSTHPRHVQYLPDEEPAHDPHRWVTHQYAVTAHSCHWGSPWAGPLPRGQPPPDPALHPEAFILHLFLPHPAFTAAFLPFRLPLTAHPQKSSCCRTRDQAWGVGWLYVQDRCGSCPLRVELLVKTESCLGPGISQLGCSHCLSSPFRPEARPRSVSGPSVPLLLCFCARQRSGSEASAWLSFSMGTQPGSQLPEFLNSETERMCPGCL